MCLFQFLTQLTPLVAGTRSAAVSSRFPVPRGPTAVNSTLEEEGRLETDVPDHDVELVEGLAQLQSVQYSTASDNHTAPTTRCFQVLGKVVLRQYFQEVLDSTGELPEPKGRIVLVLGLTHFRGFLYERQQVHAVPVPEQPRHGLLGKLRPAFLLQDLLSIFLSSLE